MNDIDILKRLSLSLSLSYIAVETIYSAICECQLLYPDPEQSDSSCEDNEEEIPGVEWSEGDVQHLQQCPGEFFTSADGLEHLTAEGEAVLAHLESILHIQPQQDAENGKSPQLKIVLCSLYGYCDYARHTGEEENGQFEDADTTDTN